MADNKEIKLGVELLDYVVQVGNISRYLSNALSKVYTARQTLESAYIGDAKEEMEMYINSYYAHIQKMIMLYASLGTYISNAFEKLEAQDEAIAAWYKQTYDVDVEVENGQIRVKEG